MQNVDWLQTIVFRIRKHWDYYCLVLICVVKTTVCCILYWPNLNLNLVISSLSFLFCKFKTGPGGIIFNKEQWIELISDQIFDRSLSSLEPVISVNGEKELFARSKSKWLLLSAFLVPEAGIPGSSWTSWTLLQSFWQPPKAAWQDSFRTSASASLESSVFSSGTEIHLI